MPFAFVEAEGKSILVGKDDELNSVDGQDYSEISPSRPEVSSRRELQAREHLQWNNVNVRAMSLRDLPVQKEDKS